MEKCYNSTLATIDFYNSRKVPLTAVPSEKDTWFNEGYDNFTIEVSGATTIAATVKGCLKITDANNDRIAANSRPWTALKIVNLSTYEAVDSITSNGLYAVAITGIANIWIDITTLTGSVTVCASTGKWGE